jgi:hypothetical protein
MSTVAALRKFQPRRWTCSNTADGCPWEVDVVIEFRDERRAVAFERYLKSGSGCAFANRQFR